MKIFEKPEIKSINQQRRQFLRYASAIGISVGFSPSPVLAHHTDTHFEDESTHKLVYQLNKADHDYIEAILFSVGEMLRKYGDDIEIIVTAIGPGIHLLGKRPLRPIKPLHQTRVRSLISYGVAFHACGNTMKSVGWEQRDLLEGTTIVPIGADDLMLLQEKGFTYISW